MSIYFFNRCLKERSPAGKDGRLSRESKLDCVNEHLV